MNAERSSYGRPLGRSRHHFDHTRHHLSSSAIEEILGKPDAVLMKEVMAMAQDTNTELEKRLDALDELQSLVENPDNTEGSLSKP
ncbi:hypothetical protein M422DRAFT_255960 [Sphaerobolus stellatus SS14]|uniref:Nucleotide exchange factor Fes1 domain-containing protein n=1 Tax=Sphaerobolus stellatus (strain SS14) TaxID=990650 RepID=A0A0C9VSR5_SPHS4|nr:hypothetical protein M422DRAFT_255960 [Sphaerobolus stellatus SS14]